MTYRGKQIFMETLIAEGVRHIFGNPGTTELPVMDSLRDYPQLEYVLCLQEAVAVSMADAYAIASDTVGVVNLHVAPGLGNGLGSVYNAWEGGTPLLITAGQQDHRMRLREPVLGHDLVAMAAPLTKWSVEAQSADELPLILHRAFKIAREAPTGPVFVALPIDVMEERTEHPPIAPSGLFAQTTPDAAGVAQVAERALGAKQPMIVCGDEVARAGAGDALISLAERIGAAVYYDVLPARLNFPTHHSNFRDRMVRDQKLIRATFEGADLILLIGGEFFEEVWFADADPFPPGAAVVGIEPVASRLGRNYRVDYGLVGDVGITLQALDQAIEAAADQAYVAKVAARQAVHVETREKAHARQRSKAAERAGNRAMSTAALMAELASALPPNASVCNESITASPDLLQTLDLARREDYIASRGGGIGQGLPGAIGMKIAYPDRPVIALSGDGSALYTIQALWTAAHHRIPVVFLILNNGAYRILKLNMNTYRNMAELEPDRGYPHLDLADPLVDFVTTAAGLGVEGRRVEKIEEVASAVEAAFASGKPYLLDVVVDGSVG